MTRRALLALAGLSVLPRWSFAQSEQGQEVFRGTASLLDVGSPVNRWHPLAPSVWWLALPQRIGGKADWLDLCGTLRLTPTNIAVPAVATSGYGRGTTRVGGYADIRLNGSNNYWTMPKNRAFNLTQGTVVVSAYRATGGTGGNIVSLGDGTANGTNTWAVAFTDSNNPTSLSHSLIGSGAFVINALSAVSFSSSAWYQVAVTCNAQGNALYADGRPLALTYSTGNAATASWWSTIYAGITTLDVGRANVINFPAYLPGRVDDIRLYPRALTAKEVQAVYVQTKLGYPGLLRSLPSLAVARLTQRSKGRVF